MSETITTDVPNDKFARVTKKVAHTAQAVESVLTVVTAVGIVVGTVKRIQNRKQNPSES